MMSSVKTPLPGDLRERPETAQATQPPRPPEGKIPRDAHSRGFSAGFLVKLLLMALVNAFGLYGILASWAVGNYGILIFLVVLMVIVDLIYFLPTRKLIPAKYLTPGLIFLAVFQIFVVIYTAGVAFTNYGDGHNATKEEAIDAIVSQNAARIEGSPDYSVSVIRDSGGRIGFAAVDESDDVVVGFDGEPVQAVTDATVSDGRVTAVDGADVLDFSEVVSLQSAVVDLRVPLSDDPDDGFLRTNDGRTAYVYEDTIVYDQSADTMTAQDGTVYTPNSDGNFESADGQILTPGWRVNVGFDNFGAIFDNDALGGPFVTVTLWTFAFAILSVASTFFLGLLLAILFNNKSMKGRSIYRTIMILPYAFPGFLSILIWAGLLNRDFGYVNDVLLGGFQVAWLSDPWLAKFSLVFVNLWLGFPYMFLIATGALQAIPEEVYESARMDGASPAQAFRAVTLPLMLVAVGPLLIASFAMNFNNFNMVYLLTGGGPQDLTSSTGVGATDILITFVYKIAFVGGVNQYGLASAVSILIFIMIAVISAILFRRSRTLEDIS
jgi:arabinogalactan oligomer/maltooligosaccharide transport system permease protein